MTFQEQLEMAFTAFDYYNSKDPNKESVGRVSIAKELLYGKRMSLMLENYVPNASLSLKLAARSQHLCRWQIPRDQFPLDRKGYLLWRTELKKFHAEKATKVLMALEFDPLIIAKVTFLLEKKKLRQDPESQTLEDVVCLVFLQYYFRDFHKKHPEEKVIHILQKTWAKMSKKAHEAALKISFAPTELQFIEKALL